MNSYVKHFRDLEVYKKQRDVSEKDFQDLTQKCEEIGRMLGAMIRKADSFASSDFRIKEEPAEYAPDSAIAIATDY